MTAGERALQLVPAIFPLPPVARVRQIFVVAASARSVCAVCADGNRQRLWLHPGTGRALGRGGCAHCGWGIPIAYPPMRQDCPREEA